MADCREDPRENSRGSGEKEGEDSGGSVGLFCFDSLNVEPLDRGSGGKSKGELKGIEARTVCLL